MRVYLDSNVFIGAIEGMEPDAGAIRALLALSDGRPGLLATSELSLAEVLVVPFERMNISVPDPKMSHQTDPAGLARDYSALIVDRPGMLLAHVDRSTLMQAARIRAADRAIRLADAIHAATADLRECTHFLSADKDLLKRVKGVDPVALTSQGVHVLSTAIQISG
jgi:predicted nucleic acid-binding protein